MEAQGGVVTEAVLVAAAANSRLISARFGRRKCAKRHEGNAVSDILKLLPFFIPIFITLLHRFEVIQLHQATCSVMEDL